MLVGVSLLVGMSLLATRFLPAPAAVVECSLCSAMAMVPNVDALGSTGRLVTKAGITIFVITIITSIIIVTIMTIIIIVTIITIVIICLLYTSPSPRDRG